MSSSLLGRKRTYEEACEDSKEIEPSNTTNTTQPQPPPQQTFSKELLQIYYGTFIHFCNRILCINMYPKDRLFPYQDMFNWLSYFNDPEHTSPAIIRKFWRNREFSFTLKDDIYVRYKSYKNLKEWKDDLRRKCPYKIDIGALYNIEPCRRSTISSDKFIAEEKELVFDIDISDYDDVRTCCSEAAICNKCWPLMCCAVDVIDRSLREDFGLKHLLWVFSGRRGIHCWCGDDIVRKFDVQQRSAMIDYLKLYEGNAMNKFKVDLRIDKVREIHDSLNRAFALCVPYFIECSVKLQHCLDSEKGIQYFVDMIRFNDLKHDIYAKLHDMIDCDEYEQKWKVIEQTFEKYMKKQDKSSNGGGNKVNYSEQRANKNAIRANLYEIVFSYVYPRLDVEVSRHVNHLLKAPFCIHPKTGKVCSIIDPHKVKEFDPLKQPTLISLIEEYNKAGKENKDGNKSSIGWKNTSLRGVVEVFRETFLKKLQKERIQIFKSKQAELQGNTF